MDIIELKQIIEDTPRAKFIKECINVDEKTRFFSEITLSKNESSNYKEDFGRYVRDRLNNEESYYKFEKAFTYPLNINDFINDIHSKIKKIFEGEDPYYSYDLSDSIKEDAINYVLTDWFKNEAFETFCNSPNTIVLIDINGSIDDKPAPYPVLINSENIIDVKECDGVIQHIVYYIDENLIGVVDSEYYQLFEKDDQKNIIEVNKEGNNKHELGYCPAYFISNKKVNSKGYKRKNHLTSAFGEIQELTFYKTLKSIINPHAFYLFTVKGKSNGSCGYKEGIAYCVNGYMKAQSEDGIDIVVLDESGVSAKPCPVCNKSLGIGNEIKFSYGFTDAGAIAEPNDIIKFVAPDTAVLEYSDKFLSSKEESIFSNVVGSDENLNPKLNHNEVAYKYNSEGQLSVLMNWKTVFEYLIKNVNETILKLRYGNDAVKNVSINLGTKFILKTSADLYEEKKEAKGLASVIQIDEQIIRKKYASNNKEKQKRLLYLKVYPNIIDVDEKFKNNSIPYKIYIKQVMFEDFINWFEYTYSGNTISYDKSTKENVKVLNSAFDIYFKEFFEQTENKQIEDGENRTE